MERRVTSSAKSGAAMSTAWKRCVYGMRARHAATVLAVKGKSETSRVEVASSRSFRKMMHSTPTAAKVLENGDHEFCMSIQDNLEQ